MPKYIYRCPNCDRLDLEVEHSILEDWVLECDPCGATMHRVPQVPGIALKGDGWAGKTGGQDNAG